jgi:hypothetical protein
MVIVYNSKNIFNIVARDIKALRSFIVDIIEESVLKFLGSRL